MVLVPSVETKVHSSWCLGVGSWEEMDSGKREGKDTFCDILLMGTRECGRE